MSTRNAFARARVPSNGQEDPRTEPERSRRRDMFAEQPVESTSHRGRFVTFLTQGLSIDRRFSDGSQTTARTSQSNHGSTLFSRTASFASSTPGRPGRALTMPSLPMPSGVERSNLRDRWDRGSETVRRKISATFSFSSKQRSGSEATVSAAASPAFRPPPAPPPQPLLSVGQPLAMYPWGLPPATTTYAVPITQWGAGPPRPWNCLARDPELWDISGDVFVHLVPNHSQQPSFRLSSLTIEAARPVAELRHHYVANARSTPDGSPVYEMVFSALEPDETLRLRHHLATRNVFALIYNASLVGTTLHDALTDLDSRLRHPHATKTLVNYVRDRAVDDVRADPASAVSLLAWAESPGVRWAAGWAETFTHCVGMLSHVRHCAEYSALAPPTRALLDSAYAEMHARIRAAQKRLADFDCTDMWECLPEASTRSAFEARAAAIRFSIFLRAHYSRACSSGTWPPPDPEGSDTWLTRRIVRALHADFSALYDFLVDSQVVWDTDEARSGRKHLLVRRPASDGRSDGGNDSPDIFDADRDSEIPLTDAFIAFDNRYRFPHIPRPYPLVPESIVPEPCSPSDPSSSHSPRSASSVERRMLFAYTEATNTSLMPSSHASPPPLVSAFCRFEKVDLLGRTDPAVARLGRWTVIYAALQALASVAVDAPHVRYTRDVVYHISPRLEGLEGVPEWAFEGWEDTSHVESHCWRVWEHGQS